jgi:hypothetical protein
MTRLRENVWRQRLDFTFDAHVDRLVEFFRQVISSRSKKQQKGAHDEGHPSNLSESSPARAASPETVYEPLQGKTTD